MADRYQTLTLEELRPGDVTFTGARILAVGPVERIPGVGRMCWWETTEYGRVLWAAGTRVAIVKRRPA